MLIVLDAGTTAQRDAITEYLNTKEWLTWHYIDDLWISSDVPGDVDSRQIWQELIDIPILRAIRGLIFKVHVRPLYWGGNMRESWPWLAEHFGEADILRSNTTTID